ncbi:PASTA domain-containing protein [Cesiribacter andamanensis]|uniref:PASTA domain protein n=1 Tax=Cesiribacter andamanensis AMV16 TaxID=1279009 RepID=M7N3T3_9BACT|nr:PASTA domain-containing protein [Cesiribacter andamanensis]EMR01871.1 PASTA domain protein [Cesiribacter andamanensis AMV16]
MKVRSFKHVLIHLGIILVTGFVLVYLVFNIWLPGTTRHGETVTVPNLQGRSYSELESYLTQQGLRYEVNDSTFSTEYPPLTVMKQYPQAGAQVKENRKIFISLNAVNPPNVRMPKLIDSSVKNAQLVLRSFGLELGEITYKPDLAANAVLEQLHKGKPIEEGAYIAKGSKIDLVVGDGKGNTEFTIPNLMGMDLETAQFTIIGSGLQVGEVQYVSDPEKTPNTVLRQVPPAETQGRIGEVVDLWLVKFDGSQPEQGLPKPGDDNQ